MQWLPRQMSPFAYCMSPTLPHTNMHCMTEAGSLERNKGESDRFAGWVHQSGNTSRWAGMFGLGRMQGGPSGRTQGSAGEA